MAQHRWMQVQASPHGKEKQLYFLELCKCYFVAVFLSWVNSFYYLCELGFMWVNIL